MLLVHGTADETVPVEIGDAVFEMGVRGRGLDTHLRPRGCGDALGGDEGEAGSCGIEDAVPRNRHPPLDATLREDEAGLAANIGDQVEAAGPAVRVAGPDIRPTATGPAGRHQRGVAFAGRRVHEKPSGLDGR